MVFACRWTQKFQKVDSFIFGVEIQTCPKYTFTTFLQYLKKNVNNEIAFLPADKRQRFFKSDTVILDVCVQACLNYPKNKFAISAQYIEKEVRKWIWFFARLLQSVIMFLMGTVKLSQNTQNSKFALSLQYLKREVRDEVDF